jgi:hypothetical protein
MVIYLYYNLSYGITVHVLFLLSYFCMYVCVLITIKNTDVCIHKTKQAILYSKQIKLFTTNTFTYYLLFYLLNNMMIIIDLSDKYEIEKKISLLI